MSKILRRPMFRGGPVSSYGNGIASGLGYNEGGRVGYKDAGSVSGDISKEEVIDQVMKEFPNETIEIQMKIVNERMGNLDDRSGFEKFVGVPPPNETREDAEKRLYNYDNLLSSVDTMGQELVGLTNDFAGNFILNPLLKAGSFITGIGDTSNITPYNTKRGIIDVASNTVRDEEGNIISTNVNEDISTKKIISDKIEESEKGSATGNGAGLSLETPKSDKEVIQEYMDMFKESLGGDKEELKRAKYLELAKFGANLLAQPGGQTLGESIGKAGAPALEGISALQATERAGDRQAKALGFQAALKELEPGSLEKNAKALARLTGGTVSDAAKQLSTNASASNNKLNTIKILMESITAEPGIQYAVSEIMYDNGISRKDVSKIKDPNKITGDEVVGRYYYFEKPGSKGEVMGRWDGEQFILPGESGFK